MLRSRRPYRLSLSTFSSNKSVFHLLSFQWPNVLIQLLVGDGQHETSADAQLFCWFLLLVSVGQRNALSLVVNGGLLRRSP
jgi:hypothetical protein